MSSTHPINYTTEWDEQQIKHGNYDPYVAEPKQEELCNELQERIEELDPLEFKTIAELTELYEQTDDPFVEEYKLKRSRQLQLYKQRQKFGEVYEISYDTYMKEVTQASEEHFVVLHLYKDSQPMCVQINEIFAVLAKKHREVKFCKGICDVIVPNFSDKNVPTIIIYYKKQCVAQLQGYIIFQDVELNVEYFEQMFETKYKIYDEIESYKKRLAGENDNSEYSESDCQYLNTAEYNTVGYDKCYGSSSIQRYMNLLKK